MITETKPAVYSDFESMAALRQQASSDPEATLKQVAKHFESLYINMMLKSMRQASMGDSIFDSNNSSLYRDMYDNQIALQMSQQNGIGIAEMLVQQLKGHTGSTTADKQVNANKVEFSDDITDTFISEKLLPERNKPDSVRFESHQQFVETLMPYAEKAADELNVAPQVLIAQAALETGWGQHIQKLPNGSSSHNLFNIKADSRWHGDSFKVRTLEYHDGIAKQERSAFRVYGSYAESFRDYVDFIKNNPRYQAALDASVDPEAYAKELQDAGYATDPRYAQKMIDIFQREIVAAPYSDYLMDG